MLLAWRRAGLLGNWTWVSSGLLPFYAARWWMMLEDTYYRLEKSSMEFMTP